MANLRLRVLALAGLLATLAGAAEPIMGPAALEAAPDDDPRIDPEEIRAPAVDSTDPAWVPLYRQHSGEEGPGRGVDSLQCGGRRACEEYKATESGNQTEGASK